MYAVYSSNITWRGPFGAVRNLYIYRDELAPIALASCSASDFFAASQHLLYLSMSGWHLLWSIVDDARRDLLTGRRDMHT